MNTHVLVKTVIDGGRRLAKRDTQTFPVAASPGQGVRQGDVYIVLLDNVPAGFVRQTTWDRQLAPGTTQGSRHVLDSQDGVEYYARPNATEFTGPVLVITDIREITHPEHGHWILPPGIYGISYQRTQDVLDQQRRVAD